MLSPRHCERSEAIHMATSGEMDCFAPLAMTWIHFRDLAALIARGLHFDGPPRNRGRREDRVRAAPAVSCAIAHREHAHEHTGSAGASRPSLRNGFTAYFVLFP